MIRRQPKPTEDTSSALLSELLDAPAPEARLRPVALRSLRDQRRAVLAPYPLRTWFDRTLAVGERLLGVLVILFFCWWLVDGYGRDWYHSRYATPTPPPAEFRQAAQAAATPIAVVPPAAHPDLGVSLPVVDERWSRPNVAVDYLTPARSYVRPLQPKPAPAPVVVEQPRDLRPTHLAMPTADVDSDVVEVFVQDGAWQVADYAVGYHHGTGMAGRSNMVMAGHAGVRGSVFRHLDRLRPGDPVFVDAGGQRFEYRVRTTANVWPSQVDVLFPTAQSQVTLLTCTNWDTQRLVVVADLVGAPPAAAGGN